jgi:hypothetical protein
MGANNGSENYEQQKTLRLPVSQLKQNIFYVCVYIYCTVGQFGRLEYNLLFVGLGGWWGCEGKLAKHLSVMVWKGTRMGSVLSELCWWGGTSGMVTDD